MKTGMDRRAFLNRTAGLTLLAAGRSAGSYQANQKLNLALVGAGGRGKWFVDTVPKAQNLVALCDVDDSKAAYARSELPRVPLFHDFRIMLEKMNKEIDGVIVATPDHTHAAASLAAMKAGKHVYCEKPLTRTVHEARLMRDTARKHKVATQMGNQGAGSNALVRGVELIQEGVLGEIRETYGFNEDGGPNLKDPPQGQEPCPSYLKWDLWLGPARYREFHTRWFRYHPWRDFTNGTLGGWGSHHNYLAFMGLKMGAVWAMPPESRPRIFVSAEVSSINKLSFPTWQILRWRIPAREGLPPLTHTWVNGPGKAAWDRIEELLGRKLKDWGDRAGGLLVGTKGMVKANGHNVVMTYLPADAYAGLDLQNPKKLPRLSGNEQDWYRACRGGPPAYGNFENTGPYWEMLALGSVAAQFEGELEYDPINCKVVNNPEADALVHAEPRKGWEY